MSNLLLSALIFCADLERSLKQAYSDIVMYSPLGEYSGTTTKFGPLAKRETCASVHGLLDKFFIHLALFGSEPGVDSDVGDMLDAVAVVTADVAVVEVDLLMLGGIWFEEPPRIGIHVPSILDSNVF